MNDNELALKLAIEAQNKTPEYMLELRALLSIESLCLAPTKQAMRVLRHALSLLPVLTRSMNISCDNDLIAFESSGKYAGMANSANIIRILELSTIQTTARIDHHERVDIFSLGTKQGFIYVPVASMGINLTIYNVDTRGNILSNQYSLPYYKIIFSFDGRYLAISNEQNEIHVYQLPEMTQRLQFIANATINSIIFGSDGQYLAVIGEDNTANIFDLNTGCQLTTIEYPSHLSALALSPQGRYLAIAFPDNKIAVFELDTKQRVAPFMVHEKQITRIAFHPIDSRLLLSVSDDNTARIWNITNGMEQSRMVHEQGVTDAAFIREGQSIVTIGMGDIMRVWEAPKDGNEIRRLLFEYAINAITFSPNGRYLAIAGADKSARIWDIQAGQQVGSPMLHKGYVNAVAFSPNGNYLATATADKSVHIWDILTGQQLGKPMLHEDFVNDVAFSPDGNYLASCANKCARIWDVKKRRQVGSPMLHEDHINRLCFSPDGKYLATASNDGSVRIWQISGNFENYILIRLKGIAGRVVFSPDGNTLAIAASTSVQLWSLSRASDPQKYRDLKHIGYVRDIVFSRDGQYLASAYEDRYASVWNVETGSELDQIIHDNHVKSAAFSPDNQQLVTVSGDNDAVLSEHAIAFWLWKPEDLIHAASARLTRNLTIDEWNHYLKNRPYKKRFSSLPAVH